MNDDLRQLDEADLGAGTLEERAAEQDDPAAEPVATVPPRLPAYVMHG